MMSMDMSMASIDFHAGADDSSQSDKSDNSNTKVRKLNGRVGSMTNYA